MPTVSWTGTFAACGRRVLRAIEESAFPAEFVVVFDGEAPPAPQWLKGQNVTILSVGRRAGPAFARNLAAESARGEILFFVDADVELGSAAIDRVMGAFAANPDLVGIFGAYDDAPAADGIISTFRNLLHHHVHVTHPGIADTFWSGCGALRTATFLDAGGFDDGYIFPSVEDIELGMRISSQSGLILLDPLLRCKHLKQWTLSSMLVADIFHRAVPWTHLILDMRQLPATLNIDWRGRVCGVLSVLLAFGLLACTFVPAACWLVPPAIAGLALLNVDFYRLCLRNKGLGFAVSAFGLHVLYFLYSTITFAAILLIRQCAGSRWSDAWNARLSKNRSSRRQPSSEEMEPSVLGTATCSVPQCGPSSSC